MNQRVTQGGPSQERRRFGQGLQVPCNASLSHARWPLCAGCLGHEAASCRCSQFSRGVGAECRHKVAKTEIHIVDVVGDDRVLHEVKSGWAAHSKKAVDQITMCLKHWAEGQRTTISEVGALKLQGQ